jgi:hypothetical protein
MASSHSKTKTRRNFFFIKGQTLCLSTTVVRISIIIVFIGFAELALMDEPKLRLYCGTPFALADIADSNLELNPDSRLMILAKAPFHADF